MMLHDRFNAGVRVLLGNAVRHVKPPRGSHRLRRALLVRGLLVMTLLIPAAACTRESGDAPASLGATHELVLQVHGLRCGCGDQIREALGRLEGVASVDGDFIAGRVVIMHDPARVTSQAIIEQLDKAGFPAEPYATSTKEHP